MSRFDMGRLGPPLSDYSNSDYNHPGSEFTATNTSVTSYSNPIGQSFLTPASSTVPMSSSLDYLTARFSMESDLEKRFHAVLSELDRTNNELKHKTHQVEIMQNAIMNLVQDKDKLVQEKNKLVEDMANILTAKNTIATPWPDPNMKYFLYIYIYALIPI
jgi:hypothetical protein